MSIASIKKNTIYNMIKTASTIIFPLITFPYITRVLQPENIGKINFGASITSYISLLATLGVATYAIRECSKVKDNREDLGKISGEIISINLFTTVVAYIVLIALLWSYGKLRNYRLLIMIQSLPIIFNTLGADWLNTAMEDFKYITIRSVAFQLVSIILMFIFVKNPDDYIKYAIITVFSSSGSNILNILYRRRYCKAKLTIRCEFKKHFPPIFGLFAMLVAQQIFTASDTTIIGLMLGDYQVGLYSAAVRIYNVINQILGSITWVVMAQLSAAFSKNDTKEVVNILKYVIQFSSVFGIPCVVGLYILSPEIITLFCGQNYIGSGSVLRLLSIALAVSGIVGNYIFNINLLAAGKDKICVLSCCASAILNVVTNIIFIPMYGINAAAITTIVSFLVPAIICVPFLDKNIQLFSNFKNIIKPAVASAFMAVIVIAFKFSIKNVTLCVLISVISGAGIYFLILMLLKDEFVVNMAQSCLSNIRKINVFRGTKK